MRDILIGNQRYNIFSGGKPCNTFSNEEKVIVYPDVEPYDVGVPSFIMTMEKGVPEYYTNGRIEAYLSATSPTFTATGVGPFADINPEQGRDGFMRTSPASTRKYINLKMDARTQQEPWLIEFWMKLGGTTGSIDQTFLGNMVKNGDNTYSGWAFRWANSKNSYGALDLVWGKAGNLTDLDHSYSSLEYYGNHTHFTNNTASGAWAHYGIYWSGNGAAILNNGYSYLIDWSSVMLYSPVDDIYIGNSKFGTGYITSPMSNLRVLTGSDADNYMTLIGADQYGNNEDNLPLIAKYTVPTGPFAVDTLFKNMAVAETA